MKPICVPCERFYRMKRGGYYFLEGMPAGAARPEIGKGADGWKPYKLWVGDLWECPTCKHQLVSGVPHQPIAEHYHAGFEARVADFEAHLLVKDC